MDVKFTAEELLLDESFIDYCQNENSAFKMKWERIIADYPGQQKVIDEAKELLPLLSPRLSGGEIDVEVQKLRDILQPGLTPQTYSSTQSTPSNLYVDTRGRLVRKRMLRFAALAIIAVGIYFGINALNSGTEKRAVAPLAASYSAGTGERKQIQLPDGSAVILNSNSTISIATDFGETERRVQLQGKAFFNVAKNASRPFIVSSNGFSTTAIGTAFYIDSRTSETAYQVTLLEGKVKLESGTSTLALAPGQEGQWKAADGSFTRTNVDTTYLRNWISGTLAFDRVPVAQAFAKLQKWYGVEILDQRKAGKDITITGEYANQPLADVLKVICFSLSCNYKISGNKIIIQ